MHKKYHLEDQPIPEGYRIFQDRCQVMGVSLRQEDVAAFCEGTGRQWIEFDPDPNNPHDRNAIKVWGCWNSLIGKRRKLLGFVDREEAANVAKHGLISQIQPRLLKTYVGHDGFVEVQFQILGPAELYFTYNPAKETAQSRSKMLLEIRQPQKWN